MEVPHASAVIMEGLETPEGEKVQGFYSACKDTCEARWERRRRAILWLFV